MSENSETLQSYESKAKLWMSQTPSTYDDRHKPLLKWIDSALSSLPLDAKILEIGSANGRDANYIEKRGYVVERTDAALAFVSYLKGKGHDAKKLNILEDELDSEYDLVFANAVFPHFTPEDTRIALGKIHRALKPGGLLALNVKQGDNQTWVDEKLGDDNKRFIFQWKLADLFTLLDKCGYRLVYSSQDSPGDLASHTWAHLVVKKSS
jgi:SAM-dependent methyltransferase